MCTTKDKPFLTYDQQIEKLTKDKGLTITDYDAAKQLLKKHSYFALISGYKKPFKAKNGMYKPHTTLDDINELIGRLSKIASDPKDYSYIQHQKNRHGNIPLWVMMKALTLGTVSKLYSFLPQNIQAKVSMEFEYITENELVRMLDLLARVRNVCAHNERLFNYRYNKGSINDTYIHSFLNIPKPNVQYSKGKQDLFAVIIVLKYLLTKEEFSRCIDDVDATLQTLLSSTKCLQKAQMYKYMGFPNNWKDIKDAPYAGNTIDNS